MLPSFPLPRVAAVAPEVLVFRFLSASVAASQVSAVTSLAWLSLLPLSPGGPCSWTLSPLEALAPGGSWTPLLMEALAAGISSSQLFPCHKGCCRGS